MRPSFHYLAAFPRVQAPRGDGVPAARAPAGEQERYLCNSWPVSWSHYVSRCSRGRMLEQFMRLKQNLYCGRHVSGNIRLNHRKQPTLVLHPGRYTDSPEPVIAAHSHIRQTAPAGQILLADLLVAEIQLHAAARSAPVARPSLLALPCPAQPTSQQIAVVRISVEVSIRCVVEPLTVPTQRSQGVVRVAALRPKLQSSNSGEHRDVNPGPPHAPVRISNGEGPLFAVDEEDDLVVRESLAVKRQPFSEFGNPLGKIQDVFTTRLRTPVRQISPPVK